MSHDTLLERRVVLRAAEDIGHDLAEDRTAAQKLNHAGSDRGAEERAAIEAANNASSEFQFAGKSGANPVGVHLGIAFGNGFAEKFARAHSVEETFAGERVNESGSISNKGPVFADNGALRKCRNLRRWQHMTVEASGFGGESLFADECLQMCAKFGLIVRSHAAADADG